MLKRLVTFSDRDGRFLVEGVSEPIDPSSIECPSAGNGLTSAWVDADYELPAQIEGKQRNLYYNPVTSNIDVEYIDLDFKDLTIEQQVDLLQIEVAKLYASHISKGIMYESDVPMMLRSMVNEYMKSPKDCI